MDAATFLAFVATTVLMDITPGPAVLKVVGDAMGNGARRSQASVLGILTANGMYCLISALGLSALVLAVPTFFEAVRWAGVAYLAWVAAQSVRTALTAADADLMARPKASAFWLFRTSFVLQGANPKSVLYFCAVLPAFAGSGPDAPLWIVILGALSVVLEYPVLFVYSVIGSQAARMATRAPMRRLFHGLAGSAIAGSAVLLARTSFQNR
jgi:threonine/homoserine/homoserine lactone efflux protein